MQIEVQGCVVFKSWMVGNFQSVSIQFEFVGQKSVRPIIETIGELLNVAKMECSR